MEKSKSSTSALIDLLLANFLMSGSRNSVDDSSLKSLVRGKGEAASLAKGALRDLEMVVSLAQSLGVKCPIYIYAGLPISYDRASSGGIVWQMIADLKPNRSSHPSILAVGERYDTMLHEFQKQAQSFNANAPPSRGISGAGISFSLDKLVAAVAPEYAKECRAIDVGVCIIGSRPPLKDVTYIFRLLWSAGIRCGIVESVGVGGDEAAQDLAKLGALHVILVDESGELRVRSWERGGERFQERHVTRTELVEFIQKMLRTDASAHPATVDYSSQVSSGGGGGNIGGRGDNIGLSLSASNPNIKNNYNATSFQLPQVQVVFLTHDKFSANLRRRYENQVTQQMTSTLQQFVKKEHVIVLVVDLPTATVNAIVGAMNPRGISKKETEQDINIVLERFPKYRRYISEIYDEVVDYLQDAKSPILALYSITESFYRVII